MDSLLQISKTGHSAEGVKVLPPVSAIQIGKSNGRSAVDHHAVADIKTTSRFTGRIESGNDVPKNVDNLTVLIDPETAHRVMDGHDGGEHHIRTFL